MLYELDFSLLYSVYLVIVLIERRCLMVFMSCHIEFYSIVHVVCIVAYMFSVRDAGALVAGLYSRRVFSHSVACRCFCGQVCSLAMGITGLHVFSQRCRCSTEQVCILAIFCHSIVSGTGVFS